MSQEDELEAIESQLDAAKLTAAYENGYEDGYAAAIQVANSLARYAQELDLVERYKRSSYR